ncbi:H-NS family nucleoid-associated regulatory protein [Cupriavidus sp. 2TAF22]|uniref:H-NS family nucleoid-associated regulatory protein n=1 Tax=unclassified Cupriavidus TaxID=2640874 RepID=UPI003F911673
MSESDEARVAAAAWVREQMDRHGLTLEDLVEAGCFPASLQEQDEPDAEAAEVVEAPQSLAVARPATPLYRNALGQSWDGTGERPEWLQRAVNAGQSMEFFRVE